MRRVFLLLVVAGLFAWAAVGAFRTGPGPAVTLTPGLPAVGKRTPVAVEVVAAKRGLGKVLVQAVQGERVTPLAEQAMSPASSWKFWKKGTERWQATVDVGRAEPAAGFHTRAPSSTVPCPTP